MEKTYTVTFTVEEDGKMMLNRSMSKGMDGITMLGLLEMERQSVYRLMSSPEKEQTDGQ